MMICLYVLCRHSNILNSLVILCFDSALVGFAVSPRAASVVAETDCTLAVLCEADFRRC